MSLIKLNPFNVNKYFIREEKYLPITKYINAVIKNSTGKYCINAIR